MELKIDLEFSDLIPPLTDEEFVGLEKNILTQGFNPKYPIIVWNGIIIDGHHRYKICQKHNIEFPIEEMQFESRSDVIIWMCENQQNRRNANKMTLVYLIGRQFIEQNKGVSGNNKEAIKRKISEMNSRVKPQNEGLLVDTSTSSKIGKKSNLGHATVERAAVFATALDTILLNCKDLGVVRKDILLGTIKTKLEDIKTLDNCKEITSCQSQECTRYAKEGDKSYRCGLIITKQRDVMNKVLSKAAKEIGEGIKLVDKEERERVLREAEEREEQELRKRENERKRLEYEDKKAREEKDKLDRERRAQEEEQKRIEREQKKKEEEQAELERKKKEEEDKAKKALIEEEQRKVREEQAELARKQREQEEEQKRIEEEERKQAEAKAKLEEDQRKLKEEEERKALEESQKIKCELGNWYQLGENLLYCGDNNDTKFIDKLKEYPIKYAFADPPYNANVDEWDSGFSWTQDYLTEFAEIAIVTPGIVSIQDFMCKTKMPYKWSMSCIIENGHARGALGFGNWIYLAVFAKGKVHINSQDIIKVVLSPKDNEITKHKGRKPRALINELMFKFTKEGEYILDPFLGSGTSLLLAEAGKRKCIGAELSQEYCNDIIKDWEKQTGKKTVKL